MTGTVVVLSENCTKFINGSTRSVKFNPPTKQQSSNKNKNIKVVREYVLEVAGKFYK